MSRSSSSIQAQVCQSTNDMQSEHSCMQISSCAKTEQQPYAHVCTTPPLPDLSHLSSGPSQVPAFEAHGQSAVLFHCENKLLSMGAEGGSDAGRMPLLACSPPRAAARSARPAHSHRSALRFTCFMRRCTYKALECILLRPIDFSLSKQSLPSLARARRCSTSGSRVEPVG